MTAAELYAGTRSNTEKRSLKEFLGAFIILPVDEKIAELGGEFRNQYNKSHGVDLIDALIAATSHFHQIQLVTLNKKYFPMLEKIIIPYK